MPNKKMPYYCFIEMGGCMTGEKPSEGDSSRYHVSQKSSEESQVEQYQFFREELNFKKKSLANRHKDISIKESESTISPIEPIKKPKTIAIQHLASHNRQPHQLPSQIVNFISRSKLRYESIQKEKQSEARIEKLQATQYLVQKSIVKESRLESPMVSLISDNQDDEESSVLEIISSYGGSSIYESKLQRELLSSSQFRQKLSKVKFIQRQPAEEFKFICELGKGNMCKVFKVSHYENPMTLYAVRIIAVPDEKFLTKIKEEIAVMELCKSENIIRHFFTYHFEHTLFMFIEHMDQGSLNQFIKRYGKNIDERVIAYIIREILKGLRSIHRKRQLHRDLKSDNILINRHGDIKIGDFGYALQLTKEKSSSKEIAGTPAWMAPELIKKEDYNQSVDIWSLGIILVQLCEGVPRYLNLKPLMAMIMIATRPPETVTGRSSQLQLFLGKCLKKDPRERATVRELLSDPFITSLGAGVQQKGRYMKMLESNFHSFI